MASAITTALALVPLLSVCLGGRVPPIPAGHRVQYSLQHEDGSYKYGWDTAGDSTAQVEGDANNEVRGSYSAGPYSVHYTAGVNGFVPTIVGDVPRGPPVLPPPRPPPPATSHPGYGVKTSWSSGWNTGSAAPAGVKTSWSSGWSTGGRAPAAPKTSWSSGWNSGGGASAAPDLQGPGVKGHVGPAGPLRPDGSYSFSYNTGDQSRQESADPSNNVRGSFSFQAKDDGRTRTVNYVAGAHTGFVAQGAHLPTPPPAVPQTPHSGGGPDGGDGQWVDDTQQYSVPEPEAEPEPEPEPDAAYQFGYQSKDAARQEASDSQGNIRGSYSYVGPDGVQRQVEYEAGAGKGFVAKGDHLPKDGDVAAQPSPQQPGIVQTWQTPAIVVQPPTWQQPPAWQQPIDDGGLQQTLDDGGLQQTHQPPVGGPANVQAVRGNDGSYAFAYNTQDQSRQEQGDSRGNVQGSFSFVAADDGQRRKVVYNAGAPRGFVAKGDHLPKPQPSEVQPQAGDDGGLQQTVQPPVGGPADVQSSQEKDGSYAFSYSTPDQHREEQGDAQGSVKGSFSFVAPDDGQRRRVDYHAGADTGFVAEGDHLPKPQPSEVQPQPQPAAKGRPHGPTEAPTESPVQVDDKVDLTGQIDLREENIDLRVGGNDDSQQTIDSGSGDGGDEGSGSGPSGASYKFAYETPDSSRQEDSDARGNVKGAFSFVAPDGVNRRVDYEAGAGKGFVAQGDHLPKAPAEGAATGGVPLPPGDLDQQTQQPDDSQQTQGPWDQDDQQQAQRPVPAPAVKTRVFAATSTDDLGHVVNGGAYGRSRGLGLHAPPVRTYLPPAVPGHKVGYVYEER